jgi:hypothetical protein
MLLSTCVKLDPRSELLPSASNNSNLALRTNITHVNLKLCSQQMYIKCFFLFPITNYGTVEVKTSGANPLEQVHGEQFLKLSGE